MIDDGLGFSLVPWQPVLDQRIGRHVAGVMRGDGGIEWNLGTGSSGWDCKRSRTISVSSSPKPGNPGATPPTQEFVGGVIESRLASGLGSNVYSILDAEINPKVILHLTPAGSSKFGFGSANRTPNVPLAASMTRSTTVMAAL
jgi:hypothetical protein